VLKCTKFNFGITLGITATPPPDPLAGFGGPTSKGSERKGMDGRGRD